MSKKSIVEKNKQLGMNHSTASARLKKDIMFMLLVKLGLDVCYQCGEKIYSSSELSVEHKTPWMYSEDPVKLFFDLDNISFSHLACNSNATRPKNHFGMDDEFLKRNSWCGACKKHLPIDRFGNNSSRVSGLQSECKICRSKKRKS